MRMMRYTWPFAIRLCQSVVLIMLVSQLHAAGNVSPMRFEEQHAPVVINHFAEGKSGIVAGYPQGADGTSAGEFTLYQWQKKRGKFTYLGYSWSSNAGHAYTTLLQLSSDGRVEALLLADDKGCRMEGADDIGFMRDPVGYHPVVSIIDGRLSTDYGDLTAILAKEIDWRDLPLSGTRFPRPWRNQAHLDGVTPESFGIVMRYEPTGGYRQGYKGGQGNTPHHWNLLAYMLKPLQPDDNSVNKSAVMSSRCGDLLNQPGVAFRSFTAQQ